MNDNLKRGINVKNLRNDLIDLVGWKFHVLDKMLSENKTILEIHSEEWKDRYVGRKNLKPCEVEYNGFKIEVDQFVDHILDLVKKND